MLAVSGADPLEIGTPQARPGCAADRKISRPDVALAVGRFHSGVDPPVRDHLRGRRRAAPVAASRRVAACQPLQLRDPARGKTSRHCRRAAGASGGPAAHLPPAAAHRLLLQPVPALPELHRRRHGLPDLVAPGPDAPCCCRPTASISKCWTWTVSRRCGPPAEHPSRRRRAAAASRLRYPGAGERHYGPKDIRGNGLAGRGAIRASRAKRRTRSGEPPAAIRRFSVLLSPVHGAARHYRWLGGSRLGLRRGRLAQGFRGCGARISLPA